MPVPRNTQVLRNLEMYSTSGAGAPITTQVRHDQELVQSAARKLSENTWNCGRTSGNPVMWHFKTSRRCGRGLCRVTTQVNHTTLEHQIAREHDNQPEADASNPGNSRVSCQHQTAMVFKSAGEGLRHSTRKNRECKDITRSHGLRLATAAHGRLVASYL